MTYPDNGYTVSENDDISFLFIVRDSFGEEIYAEITSDAPLVAGNTVNITVTATDDAGNVFESTYLFGVLPAEDPFVTLMVSDALWQGLFVTDNVLPLLSVDGMAFYGWVDGKTETEQGLRTRRAIFSLRRTNTSFFTRVFIPRAILL